MLTGTYDRGVKEVYVGPTTKRGKDLPSGKNLFDYIDKQGRMCLVRFFGDHKDRFPTLWILVQREASRQVVEVGGYESFLAPLDTFLPHGELGLEYEIMRGLQCYQAF